MKRDKLLARALASPNNLSFREFVALVEAFGFHLARTAGSHHIYLHPDVPEAINIQRARGKAKPYQVRQFLRLVESHNLGFREEP